MDFLVLGISHKTSPVALREKFYLEPAERELFLSELHHEPAVAEALIISTCNRTEIYARMTGAVPSLLIGRLCALKGISLTPGLSKCFYSHAGQAAARHLFSVTCGLDSLIVGEKEILGQVKAAIELSRKKQLMGGFLNILTNAVLRTAKKARHETAIGTGGSSVSWAAVKRAERFFGSLTGKSVLIIGAGKMSHLAAGDFRRRGVDRLFVMNRTQEKGRELAGKFEGEAVDFCDLRSILGQVDVCIASASAPTYLIEPQLAAEVSAGRQAPLLLIDISMPRNIHPAVADLQNVTLLGLDELDKVLDDNLKEREAAVDAVEGIIAAALEDFTEKWTRHQTRKIAYVAD